MENNNDKSGLQESQGTGVLSTMIFMVLTVVAMILLKNFLG